MWRLTDVDLYQVNSNWGQNVWIPQLSHFCLREKTAHVTTLVSSYLTFGKEASKQHFSQHFRSILQVSHKSPNKSTILNNHHFICLLFLAWWRKSCTWIWPMTSVKLLPEPLKKWQKINLQLFLTVFKWRFQCFGSQMWSGGSFLCHVGQ